VDPLHPPDIGRGVTPSFIFFGSRGTPKAALKIFLKNLFWKKTSFSQNNKKSIDGEDSACPFGPSLRHYDSAVLPFPELSERGGTPCGGDEVKATLAAAPKSVQRNFP
jgi:hypothetical protein